MDLATAARAVAMAASLAGVDAPRAPLVPAARPVKTAGAALLEVARVPLSQAQGAREQGYVSRPAGFAAIEAAIAADGTGDFWVRLRQDGRVLAWPAAELENGARACFPSACYQVRASGGRLTVEPEGGQEGRAAFSFDELSARVLATAPRVKLSDSVQYSVVAEPGPRPAQSVVFWHRDLSGAVWLAYRAPAELARTTWLVVIDGVYFGVRQDGTDLVFEKKAGAGVSSLLKPRERRLPGT